MAHTTLLEILCRGSHILFENSVDPDHLATGEAFCTFFHAASESTVFIETKQQNELQKCHIDLFSRMKVKIWGYCHLLVAILLRVAVIID